mmetsp:Transcript_103709/g.329766  ORF Transcript_103709/g.329766 Transcript_103709/m.329766 type:complete len:346 (-) Transcript_103709:9-1046(-)
MEKQTARDRSSVVSTLTKKSRPSSLQWLSRTSITRSAVGTSSTLTTGGGGGLLEARGPLALELLWQTSFSSLRITLSMFSLCRKACAFTSQFSSCTGTLKLRQSITSRPSSNSCTTVLRNFLVRSSWSTRLRSSLGPTPLTSTLPLRAASKMESSVPCLVSSCAAFFGPMPGTPGMLSTESPASAKRSPICSGCTPHRFSTLSTSNQSSRFCKLEWIRMPLPASCMRSLSTETMLTLHSFTASLAYAAMRSSASKPSTALQGTQRALHICAAFSSWSLSSGGQKRFALYCGSSFFRRVDPVFESSITAKCVGWNSRCSRLSWFAKPTSAPVGCPLLLTSLASLVA